ncbi:MAG TPA: hypothetical protein VGE45_18900 [Chloroflexia bacterium]|jgi:hypothetical protein
MFKDRAFALETVYEKPLRQAEDHRMKLSLFLLSVSFMCILVLVGCQATPAPDSVEEMPQAQVKHATYTSVTPIIKLLENTQETSPNVPKQEDVPLYPGAQAIEVGQVWPRELRHTSYVAYASSQDVLAFYHERLESDGWILLREITSTTPLFNHYYWTDPTKTAPWDLDLNLTIKWDQDPDSNLPKSEQAVVSLSLYRSPNLKRVPHFSDAQQVEVQEQIDGRKELHSVTTYVTTAKPQEVKDFYSTTLINHGWWLLEGISSTSPDSLFFNWSYGNIHNSFVANLSIVTKLDSQGKTMVEVEVSGPLRD